MGFTLNFVVIGGYTAQLQQELVTIQFCRLRVSWKKDIYEGDPMSFKYNLIPTILAQFIQQSKNEAMMMIKKYQKI
jgi:hypothetical protein